MPNATVIHNITDLHPELTPEEMAKSLVPPPQFYKASFDNYQPDDNYPSQVETREYLRNFFAPKTNKSKGGFFGRKKEPVTPSYQGVYLDGGFGVGKTHLLAALWHQTPGPKHFGTFIEYTALVGAVGYNNAVKMLKGSRLLCIDEFELDDPGDTMVMTRLLGELADSGSKIATTSNTPPNALGEGRFAASDFLREIQGLASRFKVMRIDGEDYRRRESLATAHSYLAEDLSIRLQNHARANNKIYQANWPELLQQLSKIHPAKYVRMANDIAVLAISEVTQLHNQTDALRLVAFIDRLYDAQVPILNSGIALDQVFDADMLAGGYKKKYLRAISRMISLTGTEKIMELG